jgi:hypothetical protein
VKEPKKQQELKNPTELNQESTKNTIRGQVVVKESMLGVEGLLVEALYINSNLNPENFNSLLTSNDGYRVGSTITDNDGRFVIEKDISEIKIKPNLEVDSLAVYVSAPEESNVQKTVLYTPQTARSNFSSTESYLMKISQSDLENAGVTLPSILRTQVEPPEIIADRLKKLAERDVSIVAAQRDALKLKVINARNETDRFRTDFLPHLETLLSSVHPDQTILDNYVPKGGSVKTANGNVINHDLNVVINVPENRATATVRMAFSKEQAELVKSHLDAEGKITKSELNNILGNGPISTKPYYLRANAIEELCRKISKDEKECANVLGESSEPEHPSPVPPTDIPGMGVEALGSPDIPKFLARLTDTVTSPEEGLLTDLEPRATKETVSKNIQNLSLKPSPADLPAIYNFHSLQIAFRDVWQEAIDEGIISIAEEAYNQIVLLGGEPKLDTSLNPISALRTEFSAVNQMLLQGNAGNFVDRISANQQQPIGGTFFHPLRGILGGLFNPSLPDTNWHPPPVVSDLLAELEQRMQEPYAFTTFGASKTEHSINFACLVTYEQIWNPVSYQAGRLAKTITLAPKEVQKYTKTIKRHSKRVVKEVEKHIQIRKDEMTRVSRIEEEIVRKATNKTNFHLSSEETAKDPTGSAGTVTKTAFDREASTVSDSVKRSMSELTTKAALEVNDEYVVDVTAEQGEEFELSESGEIQNPSNVTAVTFLFYELQRRYKVTEQIHKLTPIVLVAQEMPEPQEINESWLVTNDWILRRVLLDDAFLPALNYISNNIVGDRIALQEMSLNIIQQRKVIEELKTQLAVVRSRIATYRNLLEKSLTHSAEKKKGGGGGLFSGIPVVGDAIELVEDAVEAVGDIVFPDSPEVGDSRLDSIKEAIQRTADEERDLLMRLEREVTSLNALTESYSKALAENYNQRTQVLRLRTHIKQNILYYMQAIWNHEPPDQRYLRLHEVPVPTFWPDLTYSYKFSKFEPVEGAMNPFMHGNLEVPPSENRQLYQAEILPIIFPMKTEPLSKVADLDNLIGYFGNYMMFALRVSNPLTDFMMEPYILQGFNELIDPDDFGNWTLDEFVKYVLCLKEKLTPSEFEKIRPELAKQYERLIKAPWRNGEDIVVPTGSLFIESLPASETVEDRFTTIHRVLDLKMSQAKDRHDELENIRLVDRLLHNERDDPDIEKKVIIKGTSGSVDTNIDVEDSN